MPGIVIKGMGWSRFLLRSVSNRQRRLDGLVHLLPSTSSSQVNYIMPSLEFHCSCEEADEPDGSDAEQSSSAVEKEDTTAKADTLVLKMLYKVSMAEI